MTADSNFGNADQNWEGVEVSEEAYRFLEEKLSDNENETEPFEIDTMVKRAIYDFVSKASGSNEMSFYLLNGKGIVNDIYIPNNIVIDFLEDTQKIYCHFHKFLYTECPHTLWVKWESQFQQWVNTEHKTEQKPLIDVDTHHRKVKHIKIMKELFDDAMKKREVLGLYPGLSDGDFLMNIAMRFYH